MHSILVLLTFSLFLFPSLFFGQLEKKSLNASWDQDYNKSILSDGSEIEVDTLNSVCFTSISALIECLLKQYPVLYTSTFIDSGKIDMGYQVITISGSLQHLAIRKSAWEYERSEYQFYDINVNDFMELISGITLGAKGYEYQLMKNSATSTNPNYFHWENGYDDWVRSVFLEECRPKDTRITIVGGL